MAETHFPWLELAILLPLLAAVWMVFIRDPERARTRAIAICGITLVLTLGEWLDFHFLHTFEAHDHWDVIEMIFNQDIFVIDELSAPLLPLAALIYLMTVLSTLSAKVNRFSFGLTLISESLLLATLSCREPWVIIGLLSIATIPPWIELRRGIDRHASIPCIWGCLCC